MRSRNPALDQLKALACLTIVGHHFALYGPMAEALRPFMAGLIQSASNYGSMAAQVFLVLGGYWCAHVKAPEGQLQQERIWHALAQRLCRLSLPFTVALVLAIVINETVRHLGFTDPSVAATPSWSSVPAHLLMIHHIGGWQPLIAGIWYVAIDFQLYALCLLWLWVIHRQSHRHWLGPAGMVLATALSLGWWSRNEALQAWPVYFLGAYGLGMMAWWASNPRLAARQRYPWMICIALLGGMALLLQWRPAVALATLCALALALVGHVRGDRPWHIGRSAVLCWIGERSYSIFLLHFPLMLLVSAEVSLSWPHHAVASAIGMLLTLVMTLFAGDLLHEFTERARVSWFQLHRWYWAPLGAGWLAAGLKLY